MADGEKINIVIVAGADFTFTKPWNDDNGNPINLTGSTINAQLRQFSEASDYFDFVCTNNGQGGEITIKMSKDVTKHIAWTSGVYDVFVTPSGGLRSKVFYGNAEIYHNVTKQYS